MSTVGVGTFGINSKFASGALYFYEKAVGRTATGDVLSISTSAVTVGGTAQDVDFAIYGTGSKSAVFDIGAGTFIVTGFTAAFKGNVTFGVDATGVDVTFYGDTASYKVWFDQDGDTNGAWYFGASTKGIYTIWYGDTASYTVHFDPSGDTNGAWYFGADDYGVDVIFYGQTASAAVTWDASADDLIWTGVARQIMGTTGTPLVLTAGSPIFDMFSTCASTSGATSAEPFHVKSTMTGAGGVGGRAKFELYTNVALGGWANALKAYTEFGATGSVTGLASAFCAEVTLSAGTAAGTYAPLEAELVLGAGAAIGTNTSFLYCAVSGAGVAAFDAGGALFTITGVSSGATNCWYDHDGTAGGDTIGEWVKVITPAGVRYLGLYDATH